MGLVLHPHFSELAWETHTHTYTYTHMLWACFGKHWVCVSLEKTCCVYDIRWSKHSISCQGVFNFRHSLFGPSPQQPRAGVQIPICTRESWAHQVHRLQQVSQLDFFRLISLRKVITGPSRVKHWAAKLSSHSQQANGLIGLHGQRRWSSQKIQRLA